MADTSVAITAGSGTNIDTRTEGTNGNHRQVIVIGDPTTNAGVAPVDATNGLAVDVKQSVSLAVTNAGITTIAGAVAGTEMQCDVLTMPTVTETNSAAIKTAVEVIDNAISGSEMQVDVVTMPTTTVQATDLDIRDLTSASDSVAAVCTNAGTFAVQATCTNAGTFAVQAAQSTASNLNCTEANSGSIKTAVETIDNAISGSEMQVDVVTMPTTTVQATNLDIRDLSSASDSVAAVCTNAGTFAVQEALASTMAASLSVMDDWDSSDTCKVTIQNDSIVGAGDPVIDSYAHIYISLASIVDNVLVASAANKQIWVYGCGIVATAAGTVSFQDEDNAPVTGVMSFDAKGGMIANPSGNFSMPLWKLATDKDLEVDTTVAGLNGWLDYGIVSV